MSLVERNVNFNEIFALNVLQGRNREAFGARARARLRNTVYKLWLMAYYILRDTVLLFPAPRYSNLHDLINRY